MMMDSVHEASNIKGFIMLNFYTKDLIFTIMVN